MRVRVCVFFLGLGWVGLGRATPLFKSNSNAIWFDKLQPKSNPNNENINPNQTTFRLGWVQPVQVTPLIIFHKSIHKTKSTKYKSKPTHPQVGLGWIWLNLPKFHSQITSSICYINITKTTKESIKLEELY